MLDLPFYIYQPKNNQIHKIKEKMYQSNLDGNTNFYVQNIDGQYWLVTKDPIKLKINPKYLTFGRSKNSNVILSNKKATRKHCKLSKIETNRYLISDLDSKNGTFVDGNPILNSLEILTNRFILKTGDEFWLVDLENNYVETHTTKSFHKYPLVGGNKFKIRNQDLVVHQYQYGVASHIGRRKQMEDKHVIIPFLNDLAIYMIFDGHGGAGASAFVSQEMEKEIKLSQDLESLSTYTRLFEKIDQKLIATGETSGTTANIVTISKNTINVFNVGDCQAMIIYERGYKISNPHRPENEKDRLPASSLVHYKGDTLRVKGNTGLALSVSRAFGDASMKDLIISTPEQNTFQRNNSQLGSAIYIIQGCDGVWDFISPQEVYQMVKQNLYSLPQKLADILLKEIYHNKFGKDNITIIAIKLTD